MNQKKKNALVLSANGVSDMTMPNERFNSIEHTREFLRKLLSPYNGGYKRVPKEVRKEAYWCLRHYPWDMHMEEAAKKLPKIFKKDKK